jgi:predicted glycoside hydrolase/deacetylase ChbG (UPF0249 family)
MAPLFWTLVDLHLNGLEDHVGIHFNLTEGRAQSPEMSNTPRFCSQDAQFIHRRNSKLLLSRLEMNAVSAECEAQIGRFHEQGLYPTHLDSHHHVHTEWSIFRALEPILKKCEISSVRMSYNFGKYSLLVSIYKRAFNNYLRRRKWILTEYFCDYSEVISQQVISLNGHSIEAMVHPVMSASGSIVDALSEQELVPQLTRIRNMYGSEQNVSSSAIHRDQVRPDDDDPVRVSNSGDLGAINV